MTTPAHGSRSPGTPLPGSTETFAAPTNWPACRSDGPTGLEKALLGLSWASPASQASAPTRRMRPGAGRNRRRIRLVVTGRFDSERRQLAIAQQRASAPLRSAEVIGAVRVAEGVRLLKMSGGRPAMDGCEVTFYGAKGAR